MKVAQYLARFLADHGVKEVFTLTGGGAMFLNDAFAYEGRLRPVYCHHEQACAMAAEGYARIAEAPGVVNVTTGPGGINALNGVFGAYTDSIPMLVISGQVKRATHLGATPVPGLRQLGDQEVDIAAMARPVCKAVFSLFDPAQAPEVIARAWMLCQEGRPGPVWIDIPIDVQSAEIEAPASPPAVQPPASACLSGEALRARVDGLLDQLQAAQRPLFLWGTGVRISRQQAALLQVAEALQIPVTTGWTHDTIASSHPLFAGRPGSIGTRLGNIVLQSSDFLLVLGSRLNVRQTSYNFDAFAKNAHVVQVDIDPAELDKPVFRPDEGVAADLAELAPLMLQRIRERELRPSAGRARWLAWIDRRRAAYPVVAPHLRQLRGERVNPYWFVEELFRQSRTDDIFVGGNATACIVPFQVGPIEGSRRLFSNSGSASMGHDIPASIGAAFAAPARRVICLAGDGSAQLNIQELQTIVNYGLHLKVVVLANEGYLSIRSSQQNFFKRLAGEGPQSGVKLPDYCALATAYGLAADRVSGPDFAAQLARALQRPGPGLIEAMLDGAQGFEPRMSSRQLPDGTIVTPSLEDMHPFLERDELARAMSLEDF
jgi:acetolactate synthase-1/2/3 large subunit